MHDCTEVSLCAQGTYFTDILDIYILIYLTIYLQGNVSPFKFKKYDFFSTVLLGEVGGVGGRFWGVRSASQHSGTVARNACIALHRIQTMRVRG